MSNGAAYADLDNDGDLDLVVNNINKEAFIFINNTIQKNKPVQSHFLKLSFKRDDTNNMVSVQKFVCITMAKCRCRNKIR